MGQAGKDLTLTGASTGAVGHILSLSWDGPSAGVIEDLDSSSINDWAGVLVGMKRAGNVTVELNFDKTLWSSLISAVGGAAEDWTIALASVFTLVINGFISKGPGLESPIEDKITSNIVIAMGGAPNFTAL